MSIEAQFESALRAAGYEPVKPIRVTSAGVWPRLKYMNERESSGRYQLHVEGDFAYGSFGSDKDKFHNWDNRNEKKYDAATLKRFQEWQNKKKRQEEAIQTRRHKRNANWFTKIYSRMPAATEHPYATSKGLSSLPMAKIRNKGNLLCLPIISLVDNKVYGIQQMNDKGDKWFVTGSRKKGGFIPLSHPDDPWDRIYICEGYSTGNSIREATGKRVFCAVDAGNLSNVAEAFRENYPDATIIIAADNDQWAGAKWPKNKAWVNTGLTKGRNAAGKVGGFVAYPEFDEQHHDQKPTDWNDFACLYGLDAVKSKLEAVAKTPPQEARAFEPPVSSPEPQPAHQTKAILTPEEQRWLVEIQNIRMRPNSQSMMMDKDHSVHNAMIYLSYHPKWEGTFVYDEFAYETRIIKPLPWDDPYNFKWRSVDDTDLTQLCAYLFADPYTNMKIESNKKMDNILDVVAQRKTVHPVRDYFDSLRWDGDDRLNKWIKKTCNPTRGHEGYLAAIGSCFLKAAVKLAYSPGTYHKNMLVLEGEQNAGKSMLLRALATFNGIAYFNDTLSFKSISDPYIASHLRNTLIVEIQEMKGMNDIGIGALKAFISQREDAMRDILKTKVKKYPRQFILAGSTNESGWISDPTGGVRFWPVACGDINMDWIEENKEQLWAEAVHRVKAGELHYIPDDDPVYNQMISEQAVRFEGNIWDVPIAEFVKGRADVTTEQVLRDALFIPIERWTKLTRSQVCDCLRGIGYQEHSKWDSFTKKPVRVWVKK